MDIQKKIDLLNHRLDNLDKEYSNTLSELLTDVHSLKDNENERKESAKRDSEWGFNLLSFVCKVLAVSFGLVFVIGITLSVVKDVFF